LGRESAERVFQPAGTLVPNRWDFRNVVLVRNGTLPSLLPGSVYVPIDEEKANVGGDLLLLYSAQVRGVFYLTLSGLRIECLRTFISSEAPCHVDSERWLLLWAFLFVQWA
jgi:hypothetical protein